jgi:hypothetical protein
MTVPSAINKSGPYTGNGVTTSFAYGFRILDASHIRVVRTEGGVDTVLTNGFTVTGVGAAGGSVVFSVAPTAAQTITLIRNAPFTQQTDLENQGAYYAQTIEDALDLGVMRDQQLQEQVDRSVKIPVGAATFDLDALVADIVRVADSVVAVDTVAANIADVDTVAANVADVAIVADNIVDVTNFADVYQGPKAVAPTLRNNGGPLLTGDLYFDTVDNRMKVRASAAWVNAASSVNGMIAQYAYTATAGQTVFAAVYDIGFVTVYLNGVKLVSGDDFTALNGTSITLATGAAVGDSIEIIGFGAFATADMLQKSQNGADIPNKAAFRAALGTPADYRAYLSINGIGSETAPTITNLDTLTVAGEYFSSPGATGAPNGTDSFSIKHYASNAVDFAFQEAFSYTSGARWWRREMSDVWQAWVQVQGAIGFTPVEQGGGAGMGNDKIRIGWDGGSFRGNVNGTDVGRIIRNEAIQDTFNGTLNATGAPPLYACRAWVNFNGTNGSIRASGNVSSVVRNGVGDYTINFATAMPDANYAVAGFANYGTSAATAGILTAGNGYAPLAGSVRIRTGDSATGVGQDAQFVNVVIFR